MPSCDPYQRPAASPLQVSCQPDRIEVWQRAYGPGGTSGHCCSRNGMGVDVSTPRQRPFGRQASTAPAPTELVFLAHRPSVPPRLPSQYPPGLGSQAVSTPTPSETVTGWLMGRQCPAQSESVPLGPRAVSITAPSESVPLGSQAPHHPNHYPM